MIAYPPDLHAQAVAVALDSVSARKSLFVAYQFAQMGNVGRPCSFNSLPTSNLVSTITYTHV